MAVTPIKTPIGSSSVRTRSVAATSATDREARYGVSFSTLNPVQMMSE